MPDFGFIDAPNVAELKELYALVSEDDAGRGAPCGTLAWCDVCGKVLKIMRFVRVEN